MIFWKEGKIIRKQNESFKIYPLNNPFMKNYPYLAYLYIKNKISLHYYRYNLNKYIKQVVKNYDEFLDLYYSTKPGNTEILLSLSTGHQIKCVKDDLCMIIEIYMTHDYSEKLNYKINPWDVVVDIGAHIWLFSIYAAIQWARVIALEPELRNFGFLKKNIELNNFQESITPLNYALYSKEWKGNVVFSAWNTWGHEVKITTDSTAGQEIQMISINQLLELQKLDHIDLMKIDIEGGEFPIFESMTPTDSEKILCIVWEYHIVPEYSSQSYPLLDSYLKRLGFKTTSYFPYLFKSEKIKG